MTDHLTDEAVKALLDGATPDWCIYSEPEVGLPPGLFAGKIGQSGFGPIEPLQGHDLNLAAAAPDLARMYLAASADAEAAVALALQEATDTCANLAAQVSDAALTGLPEQARLRESMAAAFTKASHAIRALAPASGVAKLEALRAARDEWKRLAIAGELTARHLTIVQTELAACKELEAVLREALDKARDQGREPDYCYDNEWEYTLRWDEWQDLVDSHDTSEPVEVNTLFKGPTKWVAFVPNSRDEDGNPNDWDAVMVDSEAEARAALAQPSTEGGE